MASIDPAGLAASLRRLEGLGEGELLKSLDLVVTACVELFQVTGSGLMIADEQNVLQYAVASDGPGHVLEEVQTETGEGPCVDTFVNDEMTTTDDIAGDERWPASRDTVASNGVRAVLGVPVRLGGVPVGSLDVYRDRPHRWDATEEAALARYATVVASTLQTALEARRAGELADQLQYALDNRVVIERAVGFLMARRDTQAVTAFNLLRSKARHDRRKIGDIARDVLRHGDLT
ncbi:GAF and ANTAR domain-containing protein [Pseudonocardia sp. CA-107938]|uniref:GAF and ANTAR domain-containing protein n=1 Tax=Pseudonocardia sp. CA-107938 TaxID=3240021 RepID=UPI003D8D260B